MDSTRHKLLVSVPTLHDPNFFRSVVFMIEHTDEGALGVVLNQPTERAIDDVLDAWAPLAAPPAVAFVGGPVQQHDALIGFARVAPGRTSTATSGSHSSVASAPSTSVATLATPAPTSKRCGSSPGTRAGPHRSSRARSRPVVGTCSTRCPTTCSRRTRPDLWRTVLRRQGGDLAVSANYPARGEGPAVN